MRRKPVSESARSGMCARRDITLNGEPASISGIRNQFATVTQRTSGLSAEWSWEAAARICERDGAFKS